MNRENLKFYDFGSMEWWETKLGDRVIPEYRSADSGISCPRTSKGQSTKENEPFEHLALIQEKKRLSEHLAPVQQEEEEENEPFEHLTPVQEENELSEQLIQEGSGETEEKALQDPKEFYELVHERKERVKRFKTEGHTYKLQFQNLENAENLSEVLAQVFGDVLNKVAADGTKDERIGVCIKHPALERAILVPFHPREHLSGEAILAEIERVQQSNKDLNIGEEIEITITRVLPPSGSGQDRKRGVVAPLV